MLEAIEADNWEKLPPLIFIQGFIKNYGKFLNLDTNKLLAILRRDFEANKHPDMILESFKKPLKERRFFLTPARLLGMVVVIVVISFFAYLWVEYRQFVGAPVLDVS